MIEQQIAEWLKNTAKVAEYRQGLALLESSGVLMLLQRMGIPNFIGMGSDVQVMAAQAAHSSGQQTMLENIRYFEEKYTERVMLKTDVPDFGGLAAAIKRGDLRKEDLDS